METSVITANILASSSSIPFPVIIPHQNSFLTCHQQQQRGSSSNNYSQSQEEIQSQDDGINVIPLLLDYLQRHNYTQSAQCLLQESSARKLHFEDKCTGPKLEDLISSTCSNLFIPPFFKQFLQRFQHLSSEYAAELVKYTGPLYSQRQQSLYGKKVPNRTRQTQSTLFPAGSTQSQLLAPAEQNNCLTSPAQRRKAKDPLSIRDRLKNSLAPDNLASALNHHLPLEQLEKTVGSILPESIIQCDDFADYLRDYLEDFDEKLGEEVAAINCQQSTSGLKIGEGAEDAQDLEGTASIESIVEISPTPHSSIDGSFAEKQPGMRPLPAITNEAEEGPSVSTIDYSSTSFSDVDRTQQRRSKPERFIVIDEPSDNEKEQEAEFICSNLTWNNSGLGEEDERAFEVLDQGRVILRTPSPRKSSQKRKRQENILTQTNKSPIAIGSFSVPILMPKRKRQTLQSKIAGKDCFVSRAVTQQKQKAKARPAGKEEQRNANGIIEDGSIMAQVMQMDDEESENAVRAIAKDKQPQEGVFPNNNGHKSQFFDQKFIDQILNIVHNEKIS